MVLTNPAPEEQDLGQYYESDDYISHSGKSTTPMDQVYRLVRRFTLRWKYSLIKKNSPTSPKSVLDFGCGTGDFLRHCKNHGMSIAGVEPSPNAREYAIRNTDTSIAPSLEKIHGTFDVITLWHVLEHISDLNRTIETLKKFLAQNGTIFIAVPNLQSEDARQYRENWAAYDVPRHLWHFSRDTMQELLTRHQLKVVDVLPMRLDAFYVSLLSEKYHTGKLTIPSIARAIINGMKSNIKARTSREYSSLIYIVRK